MQIRQSGDPDRLLSTFRAGFRVFKTSPMRSATQDPLEMPLRERIAKGLSDFQRFFQISSSNFSVATPLQGCDPLI